MATLSKVNKAVRVSRDTGNEQPVLLYGVSDYPADPADANLRAMHTLATVPQVPVGYADHTPGIKVALGLDVLEQHVVVVVDNMPDNTVVIGVPARVLYACKREV
jgi:sialic acid synthase SpsE